VCFHLFLKTKTKNISETSLEVERGKKHGICKKKEKLGKQTKVLLAFSMLTKLGCKTESTKM
jgi:hypothetical protein